MIHLSLAKLAVPVDQLDLLPGNPRRGDVDAVARSYETFGQRKPIVARRQPDGRGVVIAGNHQLEAARKLGWSEIAVVWVDDDDAMATAYALADNRTADLGDYDEALLSAMLAELEALDATLLDATGYDREAIDELAAKTAPREARTDEDDAPPAPVRAKTKAGDVWLLGRHRVLCGDSTDPDTVIQVMAGERATLMATDPPYLVDYDGGNHPHTWANGGKQTGKDPAKHWDAYTDPAAAAGFFESYLQAALAHALVDRAPVYQWFAERRSIEVRQAWVNSGLLAHQEIVWVKARAILTRRAFMEKYEPCMYGWKQGSKPTPARSAPNNEPSVWEIDQRGEYDKIHPTQKPVELVRRPIEWHTRAGEVIFEPFGGSGTAVIAAERTGRRCYAIELSPQFVDVICRRWQEHVGERPVLESTGKPHDFTR